MIALFIFLSCTLGFAAVERHFRAIRVQNEKIIILLEELNRKDNQNH